MNAKLTILTGPSGAGKTTLCRELESVSRSLGLDVAGILCPALYEGAQKTGIAATNLRSLETRELARRRDAARPGELEHGHWRFDPEVFDWCQEVLLAAVPCDLLVVDELGPLELIEGRGWTRALEVLDAGAYASAVVVIRPDLVPRALSRWPHAAVAHAADPAVREGLLELCAALARKDHGSR